MLPDFFRIRRAVAERFDDYIRARVQYHLGPGLSEVPRFILHEGRNDTIYRADGSVENMKIASIEASTLLKKEEISRLTLAEILTRLDNLARELSSNQAKHMFETLDEGVKKAGNVVDGKGEKVSPEVIFDMYRKIQLDFDENGNMKELIHIAGSSAAAALNEAWERIKTTPSLQQRFAAIIQQKKEEWRAREADRTLVG